MFHMNPSQPYTGYEPNATRSSAFFGYLHEPDMSTGMAEMPLSNTIPLGLDDDLDLEGSIGRDSTQTYHAEGDETTDSK